MSNENGTGFLRKFRGTLVCAGVLLGADIVVVGSFLFSILVGPIWLLVAVAKAIFRRTDWRVSVATVAIPVITLALIFGNALLQSRMARANADKIIDAATRYKATAGSFPKTLDMLVPKYLDSVPPAKYALTFGEFMYTEFKGEHTLMWVSVPPFGRPYYKFEQARWGYLD
jgi:hypothetical protein